MISRLKNEKKTKKVNILIDIFMVLFCSVIIRKKSFHKKKRRKTIKC